MNVHRMFNSVLQTWAVDVLSLRSRGLDRPSTRKGRGRAESAKLPQRKAA